MDPSITSQGLIEIHQFQFIEYSQERSLSEFSGKSDFEIWKEFKKGKVTLSTINGSSRIELLSSEKSHDWESQTRMKIMCTAALQTLSTGTTRLQIGQNIF